MTNKIIIISSPSGAGKTTICKYLLKKINNLEISISHTTRPKRKSEKEGIDYYFIDKKKFFKLKNNKYYIETAKVFDFYYASPLSNIKNSFKRNKHILFDIDWQGAKKLRKHFDNTQIIDFFILPPSRKELKNRLIKRGRDNNNEINKRLSLAVSEMTHFNEYKYILINDTITKTINELSKIIHFHLFLDSINKKINNYKIP